MATAAVSAASTIGGLLIGHRLGSRTARDAKRRTHAFETALCESPNAAELHKQALDQIAEGDRDLRKGG